jgi:sigma-B regulation protein RsbU (phosphoserine phosphatase)
MEERVTREFEVIHPDGTIHMEVRIYPYRSGISIYMRDITEIFELRKAEKRQLSLLQQALAPPAPSIPEGWNVAAAYYPALASEKIGGDFYDVFPTRDGHVGILIGDVSGKGIEVASLAVATRNMVRAYAFGMSADAALYYSNDILCKFQTDEPSFVTVLLILLDADNGEFIYASAGHPPAAIYGADGRVRFLELGNPPVGLIEHQQFDVRNGSIGEGEKIILFTDGIIEARRNNVLFDIEGVEKVLQLHGDKQPAHLVDEIFNEASDWSSGPIDDDATILVIERHYLNA